MEGVPAKDQGEWKAKKEAEFGVSLTQQQNPNKRPKIYHGVISEGDLKMAVESWGCLLVCRWAVYLGELVWFEAISPDC
jgi:hypothetical protein